MPRQSSGAYVMTGSDVAPAVANTTIDPTTFNAQMQDFATELTNSVDRLGRGGMEANLPMGGFQINNMAPGTLLSDGATVGQAGGVPTLTRTQAVLATIPGTQQYLAVSGF